MRMAYAFLSCRKFLPYYYLVMLMLVVVLGGTLNCAVIHAADSQPAFDLQPVFTDPNNPVTGAYFVMNGHPASHLQNSLRVINTGTAQGTVTLYPVDAFTAASGGTAFRTRTAARLDVGAWIVLSRQRLTLAPGQSQIIPFQVMISSHAYAGQHVGGIVAEDTTSHTLLAKKHTINIGLQQLRAVAVQVNIPGTLVEKVVATGISSDGASIYQRLLIGLHNSGNMMVKPSGSLQIFDLKGHRLQNQPLRLNTFLPHTSINDHIYIQHKALPIGQYKALLTLTYGHQQQLFYTTMFTIKSQKKTFTGAVSEYVSLGDDKNLFELFSPWQIAVGVGILLLLIGGLFSWINKIFVMVSRLRGKSK